MIAAILQSAISEAESLPQIAQDKLGRDLIERIERMQALRADIDLGIYSLDRGAGKQLNIEDVIKRARAQYAGR